MTVKHIVWMKFKDGVNARRIEQHKTACRALVGKVPELISLEFEANFTNRAGGFTHCIIVTVPDRAALTAYLNHPEHIPVAKA